MHKHPPATAPTRDSSPERELLFVGGNKGGVGKSLVSQTAITRRQIQRGRLPVIIEIDTKPRLASVYPHETISILVKNLSAAELRQAPQATYSMWDNLFDLIMNKNDDVVVDLAANLTAALSHYLALHKPLETLLRSRQVVTRLFATTLTDRESIEDVDASLQSISISAPWLRRNLVINERDSGIYPLAEGSPIIAQLIQRHQIEHVIRLPLAYTEAWSNIVDEHICLGEAMLMNSSQWREKGMTLMGAMRAEVETREFIEAALRMYDVIWGPLDHAAP